jgi:phosphate starvation-inducible protein PhoH
VRHELVQRIIKAYEKFDSDRDKNKEQINKNMNKN